MSPVVENHALARIITDAPQYRSVEVILGYDPDEDPQAVRFGFPSGRAWTFPANCWRRGCEYPPGSATSGSGRAAGCWPSSSSIRRTA